MIAIGIGLLLAYSPLLSWFDLTRHSTPYFELAVLLVGLLNAAIPLIAGTVALARLETPLLPIGWGWVLGAHLPRSLLGLAIPAEAPKHDSLFYSRLPEPHPETITVVAAVTHSWSSLAISVLAVIGLTLWFAGRRPGWRP